jgi:SAM-dependent methyltransferase
VRVLSAVHRLGLTHGQSKVIVYLESCLLWLTAVERSERNRRGERMTDRAWYLELLACPDCGHDLEASETIICAGCGYRPKEGSPPDFRAQSPRPRTLTFPRKNRKQELLADLIIERPPRKNCQPRPARDSSELLGALEPWLRPGMAVLDLGCGPKDQGPVFQHLGGNYVGIDYANSAADMLADGHALPFRDQSFDIVFSYAVLAYMYNPFVAVSEIDRVLRPGGAYCGTTSQGEQFLDTYDHFTVWGLLTLLDTTSLAPRRFWPSYDTLHALSKSGRYPRLIKGLLRIVNLINANCPFLAPRKWLHWSERERKLDELYRAADICFVAVKGE